MLGARGGRRGAGGGRRPLGVPSCRGWRYRAAAVCWNRVLTERKVVMKGLAVAALHGPKRRAAPGLGSASVRWVVERRRQQQGRRWDL